MNEFLLELTALSVGGGFVALVLMVTAQFTHTRYAARWRCWIWLLLCLRLAIPFPLLPDRPAQQAPIHLPAMEDRVLVRPTPPPAASFSQTEPESPQTPTPVHPSASADPSPSQNSSFTLSMSQVLFVLWLAGAAGVLIWSLLAHLRFCRYLARWTNPISDPETLALYNSLGDQLHLNRRPHLLACPGLSVPMLAGLFHPVLLLPEQLPTGDALRFSLLHELTHFRRRDIWRKALALWVRAIHWFNPLVWLAARTLDRDIELSCDENALKYLPPSDHAAYGRTILSAVAALSKPAAQPNSKGDAFR